MTEERQIYHRPEAAIGSSAWMALRAHILTVKTRFIKENGVDPDVVLIPRCMWPFEFNGLHSVYVFEMLLGWHDHDETQYYEGHNMPTVIVGVTHRSSTLQGTTTVAEKRTCAHCGAELNGSNKLTQWRDAFDGVQLEFCTQKCRDAFAAVYEKDADQ